MPEAFTKFWNLASGPTNSGVLNMYVYGAIVSSRGWFSDDSDVATSSFLKDLQNYPNAKVINVYINSPGGEVFAAAAIMNQLRIHSATVNTYIDGIAASAATVIAMAGDKVFMSRSALMMIHNPSTRAQGDAATLQKSIEVLNKVKDTIVATYKGKTKMDDAELSALMDSETWLSADEALKLGFVDKITEDKSAEMVVDANDEDAFMYNGVSFAFSNFLDADKLKEKLNSLHPTIKSKQEGAPVMNFQDILNTIAAEQQATINSHITTVTDAAVTAAITAKQSVWDAEKKLLQDNLTAANAKVTTLEQATDSTSAEDKILNAMPEDARKMILDARAAVLVAENKLAEAANAKAFEDFKTSMAVYDKLPITATDTAALFTLATANKEQFASVESLLKVANTAISGGYVSLGSKEGLPESTNAATEVDNRVKKMRTDKPDMSYNDAVAAVIAADPDLYDRYRNQE